MSLPYFHLSTYFFVFSTHTWLSPISIAVFPRPYFCVIWWMGLQYWGQGAWCGGYHCHGNLHHDAGPGTTHLAEIKLPRDTWQKKLQHWSLQGNTEVSPSWRCVVIGKGIRQTHAANIKCTLGGCLFIHSLAAVSGYRRPVKRWISQHVDTLSNWLN